MKKQKSSNSWPRYSLRSFVIALLTLAAILLSDSWLATPLPDEGSPLLLYAVEAKDDLRSLFIHAIDRAEKSLTVYIYSLGDEGVIRALKRAQRRGVDLWLVCDEQAAESRSHRLQGLPVQKAGQEGLMHIKMVIVDSKLLLLGSANLTTESLVRYRNLVCAFENGPVCQVVEHTLRSKEPWKRRGLQQTNPIRFNQQGMAAQLWFLPDERAVDQVKRMIRSAEKTIKVAIYTFTRWDLAKELEKAQERGVKVEVLVDYQSSQGVSGLIYQKLLEDGVTTATGRKDRLLHHKMMIIDDQKLVCGSANLTKAAFEANAECLFILEQLTDQQRVALEKIWSCLEYEKENLKPALPKRKHPNFSGAGWGH